MKSFWNIMLALTVALSLATFGERWYLRGHAPQAVKAKCARKPVDFFHRDQYSDCLRRNMARHGQA